MFTFYIVGVVIALLFFLVVLGVMIENDEVYGFDIIVNMVMLFVLSLFSWTILFMIGSAVVYKRVKNKEIQWVIIDVETANIKKRVEALPIAGQ